MARGVDDLLKDDDVVILERDSYQELMTTIERQREEIVALEYRIKTLLDGEKIHAHGTISG